MEENPAMQRMDAVAMQRMDAVAPSILRTLRAEAILELAAETDPHLDQDSEVESVDFFDDEVLLSSLNPINPILDTMNEVMDVDVAIDGDTIVDDVVADWEKAATIDMNTASGTSSDAKSTSRQYKRSAKVWASFQESISLHKHNLPSKDLYIPGAPDDYVNRGLARLFLRYYVEKQGRTRTNYDLALNFMQRKLDDSLNKANKVAKRGAIKDDSYMKKFLKSMIISLADESRQVGSDLHAGLSSQIPRSKELALVDACYDPFVVPNLSPLAKSNVVTGYTHSGQVGHRGQEGRALMMHHGFISEMQYLGDGETVDNFIHNYGKTNRVGRLETKTFCNHRNPRMDTSAHLGMNALLRFIVLCEPFPDFLDPDDYTKRPIFRSARSYSAPYPPSTQNTNWNALFDAAGINAEKVTHQQRQQLQQKLADAGLDLMHLERFIGYATNGQKQKMNGNQLHSYLFNSPVQAVAGAADGDPNNPATFKSGWDVTVSDSELSTLCPFLFHAIDEVEKSMAQYIDPKEQESRCLLQAQGSLLAIRFRIISAVKMLASLPLDDKNNLLVSDDPIYQRWSHHPVLKLPFFGSPTFFDICTRVQNSQKQSALLLDNEPSAQHKSWFGREVQKDIVPKLTHNIRLIQSLITGQRDLRQEVVLANSTLATAVHNIHSLDETNESILICLGCLTSQIATVTAQNNALLSHFSLSPLETTIQPTPTTPTKPTIIIPPTLPNKENKSMLFSSPSVPITPSPTHQDSTHPGFGNSLYDPFFNSKGQPRKRAPPKQLNERPFSDSNLTARDFWYEYKYGTNGLPSLESLELKFGTKWRSDRMFKRSDGQSGTTLKATWSYRLPIYTYMEFLIQKKGYSEDAALELIQEVFRTNRSTLANKPNLASCKKEFVKLWGKVDLKRGILVVHDDPDPNVLLSPSI
jgi:hypothetical protein